MSNALSPICDLKDKVSSALDNEVNMKNYHVREIKRKGLTRRRAIVLNCKETCCCRSIKEWQNCQDVKCPLYPYRLGEMKKGDSKNRSKDIRAYCLWCINRPDGDARAIEELCCSEYLSPFALKP